MRESEHGEVLEYVGMGLGMQRVLRVDSGDLFFTSDGYFWEMFGGRIPIPGAPIPGKTFLSHRNDNPAQFNISIEIRHCLFGTTFRQVGGFARWRAAIFRNHYDCQPEPSEASCYDKILQWVQADIACLK